ncbi:MAG: agmatine deiminase family protein [Lewinellaceae bacterium]|nr:agmatine deiminase family protein [Saprospiraceae bacterium]MCB9340520.1 agmatine deiminase family protein [Lewinellaceae bacterium]
MKNILPLLICMFCAQGIFCQDPELPHWETKEEQALRRWQAFTNPGMDKLTPTPPPHPVRHMAEWEELEALAITWRVPSYNSIYTEMVRYASQEVRVLIIVGDNAAKTQITNILQANNIGMDNVEFIIADNNSVWMRDYGPQCVYANDVEEEYIIDWIYNRPRPKDNLLPVTIGDYLGIPVYSTTEAPDDLVHTGGNFTSDGLGTGFSSKLVLDENGPNSQYLVGPPHTEAEIDELMNTYMGINRYIKMNTLPYDEIHHIDMHMKLLDEETILMGEYPEGMADGPAIEANLQYVLSNFNSPFGKPYKVVRILQPPKNGLYPPNQFSDYRTYTNSVFVNKTIMVPFYEEQYDTIAQRIYEENFPGYKVVGINCNSIISSLGALHCITKEIGVKDPLWIVHDRWENIEDNNSWGDYEITATIKHKSGIANAQVYFTTDTSLAYSPLDMVLVDASTDTWSASIPHQDNGTEIFYYIHAEANSSKEQVRPLVAPVGYYNFTVNDEFSAVSEKTTIQFQPIYPNPADAVAVLPVSTNLSEHANIEVRDVFGRKVETIFSGTLPIGASNYFLQTCTYAPGAYFVTLKTNTSMMTQKLVVR